MRRLLTLLGALLPAAALAQAPTPTAVPRAFIWSGAQGEISQPIWSATNGSPTMTRDGSGKWWVEFNPANGATEYIERTLTGFGQKVSVAFEIQALSYPSYTCANSPTTNCDPTVATFCGGGLGACSVLNERAVMTLYAGANAQAMVALGSDGRLRAHWRDVAPECTANSAYKYTDCSTVNDCPVAEGGNPGESQCTESIFAKSEKLKTNQTYYVTLVSTADTAGARPHDGQAELYVYGTSRGTKTRWQGVCSAGGTLPAGKACGADSDCGGTATCGGSNIGNVTKVRFGAWETGTSRAYDVLVRGVDAINSNADTFIHYEKVVSLWPDADTGTNPWADVNANCAVHATCMDDTQNGLLDDDANVPGAPTTTLNTVNISSSTRAEVWDLTSYAMVAGDTLIGVQPYVAAREQADNSQNNKTIAVGVRYSASTTLSSDWDVAQWNDGGLLHTYEGPVQMTAPGNVPWTQSVLDALRGIVSYTANSFATGYRTRMTGYNADLAVALYPPPAPTTLSDQNGDGMITVGVVGDSQVNDPSLYDALNAGAAQPTNILRCALGGQHIGNVESAWATLLNGSLVPICDGGANDGQQCSSNGDCPGGRCANNSSPYVCYAERGQNAPLDYAFLMIGANDLATMDEATVNGTCMQRGCNGAHAGTACRTSADCGGDTCVDQLGPNQGNACQIPLGTLADNGTGVFGDWYCINGDNIGQCCSGGDCLFAPADCGGPKYCVDASGRPGRLCTSQPDCPGGSTCKSWLVMGTTLGATAHAYNGWCTAGSNKAFTCPLGTCLAQESTAYVTAAITRLADAAASRTGSKAVKLILVGNIESCSGFRMNEKRCVASVTPVSQEAPTCTSDAQCTPAVANTPSKCVRTADPATWANGLDGYRWLNKWLKGFAAQRNLPYIDAAQFIRRQRGIQDPDVALRDCIHMSDVAQEWLGDVMAACLVEDATVPENFCGDL